MATSSSSLRVRPAWNEQREMTRHPVTIAGATLRRHGEQPATASLHDLSIYGCRIAADERHDAGMRVWLRLASSMPIAATVVWSEDGMTGCRFDTPIDRTLMRSLTLPRVLAAIG